MCAAKPAENDTWYHSRHENNFRLAAVEEFCPTPLHPIAIASKNLAGLVRSSQEMFEIPRVGSGRVGSGRVGLGLVTVILSDPM